MLVRLTTCPGRRIRYSSSPNSRTDSSTRWSALVTEWVAGDVVLDPATHSVTRADQRVELSVREFGLLEYLMRRPGQVVSRTSILEHCWDVNYDGFSNVVDVYVGYLRKKLEQPFGRPLIRTVRGVGYVLEPVDPDGQRVGQRVDGDQAGTEAAETGGR